MNRLVFMGTPYFGELVLRALIGRYDIVAVVTQPDRKAGRGRKISIPAVKALALKHNLLVLQPATLRNTAVVQQLLDLNPDVIVVAAYGKILPTALLSLPKHGCINVHASLLPRHRGAAPIPAAILTGDRQTGVTIMLMDEGLDTGPMLSQVAVDIADDDTTGSLTEKLGQLGGKLLVETLPRWLTGGIIPQAQGDSPTPYARPLRREDGRIQWAEPAELIARKCRAFYPWPGAYTYWDKKEIKILRARSLPAETCSEAPGTVIQSSAGIAVTTGNGLLLLEQLQLAGKRPLPAMEFVRGQHTFVGSHLH